MAKSQKGGNRRRKFSRQPTQIQRKFLKIQVVVQVVVIIVMTELNKIFQKQLKYV